MDEVTAEEGLWEGFAKSFVMILLSEIGDKTFFIAAVMAMRNSRASVLLGAMLALGAMTVLSALLGWAAPNLISKQVTHWAATGLFFFFGGRSLWQAYTMDATEEAWAELQEVEQELGGTLGGYDSEAKKGAWRKRLGKLFSPIVVEVCVITFLAEWGDRSQLATIGLAAQTDIFGVILGGIGGHLICSGAAVWGGRRIADKISERAIVLCGGVLFVLFGVHSLVTGE